MPRRIQIKEKEKMRKDYIEAMRWQNREQALLPLQNTAQGKPGDKVLYQSLVVRFPEIWIKKLSKILDEFPKNTLKHEGYTKKQLEVDIKNYEFQKKEALEKLGGIVYEPVIAIINEQERQEQQQGDDDVEMSEVGVGGKKRRKSRRRRRTKKRRKSRRRKRTRKRRRKNLKKQVGGEKSINEVMDIIRGNKHIIKLKDKGFNKRCTNCRGATHVLITELIKLDDVNDNNIGWGDWSGHSVAIVKAGEEIKEKIKIDLAHPPDDIDDYYVFDGSFHQILKFKDVKSSENILFTGKLINYYNNHYSISGRKDTELSILPIADKKNRDWIVLTEKELKEELEDE